MDLLGTLVLLLIALPALVVAGFIGLLMYLDIRTMSARVAGTKFVGRIRSRGFEVKQADADRTLVDRDSTQR